MHGNTAAPEEIWTLRVGVLRFNDTLEGHVFVADGLLEDSTRPGGPFKVSSKGQFTVLWTRVVIVSNNSDNGLFNRTLKFRLNLEGSPKCLFNGPVIATRNQLIFFAMSDSPSPDDQPPSCDVDAMFRYTDA